LHENNSDPLLGKDAGAAMPLSFHNGEQGAEKKDHKWLKSSRKFSNGNRSSRKVR
jgi:hypothetical protein